MIATWNLLSTFFPVFIILAVTCALVYGFMLVPGLKAYALPTFIAGVIIAAGYYWHHKSVIKAENIVRAAWAESDKRNEKLYNERVAKVDAATHKREAEYVTATAESKLTYDKDLKNANQKLVVALADVAAGKRLYDRDAARQRTVAEGSPTSTVATGSDEAKGANLSANASGFLLRQASLADEIVIQLTEAQAVLRAQQAACTITKENITWNSIYLHSNTLLSLTTPSTRADSAKLWSLSSPVTSP